MIPKTIATVTKISERLEHLQRGLKEVLKDNDSILLNDNEESFLAEITMHDL